jgi:xanthine dehydrogenase/oxidase
MYGSDGSLYSNGTWNYKPPCSKTIPVDFRVMMYNGGTRRHPESDEPLEHTAIQGSKGVGEPPLVLSSSVFFAIKHAILSARRDQGDSSWFEMEAPATVARVQHYCRVDRSSLRLR